MSTDYTVNIMRGIFVGRDEIYEIAEKFGLDNINYRDEEDLYDLMERIQHIPKFESMMTYLSFQTLSSESAMQQPSGVIVAQKSSVVYNDSKRGTGELFDEVMISGRNLANVKAEKEMLKEFRQEFDLEGEIDTIIVGLAN